MSYVYFRLPHSTHIFRNRLTTEPEEIASLAELNGRRGFVIAPFAPSADCPILLMVCIAPSVPPMSVSGVAIIHVPLRSVENIVTNMRGYLRQARAKSVSGVGDAH